MDSIVTIGLVVGASVIAGALLSGPINKFFVNTGRVFKGAWAGVKAEFTKVEAIADSVKADVENIAALPGETLKVVETDISSFHMTASVNSGTLAATPAPSPAPALTAAPVTGTVSLTSQGQVTNGA